MEKEKTRTWYVLSQSKNIPKNSGQKKQSPKKLGPWTLQEIESQLQTRGIEPSDWITPENKPDFDKPTQTVVDLLKCSADPSYNLLDTIQFARQRQKDIFSAFAHEAVLIEFDLKKYLWIGFAAMITLIGVIKIFFTSPTAPTQASLEAALKEQPLEVPTVRESAPKTTQTAPSLFFTPRPAPPPAPPPQSLPRINMSSMPRQSVPRVEPRMDTYTPDERDELSNRQREPANNNNNNDNNRDDYYRTDIDPYGSPMDLPSDDPANIFY